MVFEGRDAAGKGGVIKRITQYLSPRVCPTVALYTPTERERLSGIFSVMFHTFLRPENGVI